MAALYFILYSALAILRHRSYHSFGFDLAVYDQAIWNTTQGRVLESTMTQTIAVPHSQLSDHFSPIYLALVPFYLLYPHPETLLVLARLKLPSGYAVLWVVVYLLFIPLAYVNLYDFHEVAFAVAPLGFALYFLERGKHLWFVVFVLLTFLIKEELALVGAGFGLYVLLGKRNWKLGLGVLAGSLAAFELLVQVVIPYFGGGRSYPYIADRYAAVGGSPTGILRTALTNPLRIVKAVTELKKLEYVIALFGPVLGLSAISGWAALLVLPTLAYTVLSSYPPQFAFSSQYPAPLIPLIVGTSIIALARLPKRAQPYVMAGVVVSTLAFSWAYGYLPFSRKFDPGLFETPSRYTSFVPALTQITPNDRVSAENCFPSHLSERRYIYDFNYQGVQDAQWVVLDYKGADYDLEAFDEQVAKVEAMGYQEVASGYGLALLRKS